MPARKRLQKYEPLQPPSFPRNPSPPPAGQRPGPAPPAWCPPWTPPPSSSSCCCSCFGSPGRPPRAGAGGSQPPSASWSWLALFTLNRIPRSREVRQSWISSVATTLYSMCYSLPLTVKLKPDLILCNGPGTCVPVCISALLLWILGLKKVIIVYVESICRVETLSLTGKILYYFSDYFIVQWPALKEKYPKSKYLGRIV